MIQKLEGTAKGKVLMTCVVLAGVQGLGTSTDKYSDFQKVYNFKYLKTELDIWHLKNRSADG